MRVSTLVCCTLLTGVSRAQTTPDFQSQAREVLLEVVVRDAHGKLVTKIDPAQVSVFEDGVRQDIKSFRLVPGREVRAELERETAAAAMKPEALHFDAARRPPLNPLRTVNVVCLILNDVNSSTRGFAFDAARKFVNRDVRPDTYIGVFSLDSTGLKPVFPFSNDRERLLKAVELASINQLLTLNMGASAMLSAVPGISVGIAPSSDLRANMEGSVITGLREIDSLIGMVKQLSQIPFQKTVLLMSTGLTRPPDQLEYWQSLIKLANKGGVTFYGLDLYGLGVCQDTPADCRTSSTPTDSSRGLVQTAATLSQNQAALGLPKRGPNSPGGSSTQGPSLAQQSMEAMHQTDYLRFGVLSANTQEALRELSESTGGFIIANTNNTEELLSKVMDDVDTHYELAYRPASPTSDGHFRKIEVKLARADLRVETRSGYFAVPETGEGPLTPGDFGALLALDAKPLPHAFDFTSKAFRFRPRKGTSQYAIAFEVPVSNLTATPEGDKHRYHAYLLALVKNAQGEIVDRVSKDVPSEVADRYLPTLRSETMTYEHAVHLAPGHYTVETTVVDQEGNRASAKTFAIENRATDAPAISDIALVRRVQVLDRPPDESDPFETPGKRAQPYLSTTLPAGALPSIYFVVYPAEQEPATLQAQFLKNGRILATQKSALPQADSTGAVPMTLQPIASPGDYEVRVRVEQGSRSAEQIIKYSIAGK